MAKNNRLWLSLCFALVTASQVLPGAAADPIKIVVEGTYPPWNTQTNDGKLTGFDVELAQEICKRAELQCEITAQVWDSQIPSLLEGKFDAMMTVGPTPKRLKVMIFSTPYAATPLTFAVLKTGSVKELPHAGEKINADDLSAAQAMEDVKAALKGKKVGVMGSTSLQEFLEARFKDGVDIRAYKSEPDQILDLKSGRIDIVFDSSAFLRGAVTKEGNEDVAVTGPLFSAKTLATTVCFGLRPDKTELKSKFDAAIIAATADGTIKTLSQKWFGFDVSP